MRALMYLLTVLAVMGLAFWAYRENYRTQAQIDEMRAVQDEIARLREDLGVLRAEWAYLNRPERLRDLVDMNFDRLRLGPVQANQFGGARNVDYPDPNAADPDAAPAGPAGALLPPRRAWESRVGASRDRRDPAHPRSAAKRHFAATAPRGSQEARKRRQSLSD
ncbi:cell division protein FtsL, partial [Paracoccus sphaerophysae]|uniref:cell division protein FtsL n=1 Tax=Paracoccus sphaerophysae TaxID=690417 RepID=UPI0038CD9862